MPKPTPYQAPNLGYATTKELLQELLVRMDMTQYESPQPSSTEQLDIAALAHNCKRALTSLPRERLNYRTVSNKTSDYDR